MVGQEFMVPSYSMVSLLQQPTKLDSDEELEYAENKSGIIEFSSNLHCIVFLMLLLLHLVISEPLFIGSKRMPLA